MLTRVVLIPVQIWSGPIWWQFIGDTLPEMIYASAWSLLVMFFVQLVGIATGTGTDTSPGVVIQGVSFSCVASQIVDIVFACGYASLSPSPPSVVTATAYVVYLFLILLEIVNDVAPILIYALLCCIYAALFGTVVYFCPRLIALLQPSFARHGGLAVRLSICTLLCIVLFATHTISFARKVVDPPNQVYWWWTYGALELIPSAVFLVIMHPNATKADRNALLSPVEGDPSTFRKPTSNNRRLGETASLLKPSVSYGAAISEA